MPCVQYDVNVCRLRCQYLHEYQIVTGRYNRKVFVVEHYRVRHHRKVHICATDVAHDIQTSCSKTTPILTHRVGNNARCSQAQVPGRWTNLPRRVRCRIAERIDAAHASTANRVLHALYHSRGTRDGFELLAFNAFLSQYSYPYTRKRMRTDPYHSMTPPPVPAQFRLRNMLQRVHSVVVVVVRRVRRPARWFAIHV